MIKNDSIQHNEWLIEKTAIEQELAKATSVYHLDKEPSQERLRQALRELSEVDETVTADPAALAAMNEAEQRLTAARDAEFDRERDDRLYCHD